MSIVDCFDRHLPLFVLMTPFGSGDWKATLIFLVQAQLALVAGSLFTVVSSIPKVCMNLIAGDHYAKYTSSLCVGVSILCGILCVSLNHRVRHIIRSKDNGRLGLSGFSQHTGGGIPFPTQLVFSGARLVSLVAGGW